MDLLSEAKSYDCLDVEIFDSNGKDFARVFINEEDSGREADRLLTDLVRHHDFLVSTFTDKVRFFNVYSKQ
jgi:hypothetical protein